MFDQKNVMQNKTIAENEMHFLISSDSNYINPVIVLMESIAVNNTEYNLVFHIITTGLSNEATSKIKNYSNSKGLTLNIITVDTTNGWYDCFTVDSRYSAQTYFYFFCHKYLPEYMDRVLWLHPDCIVDNNIADFYFMDFEDMFIIGGMHENREGLAPVRGITEERVKFATSRGYATTNTGVLLLNLKRMRKEVTLDFYKPFIDRKTLSRYDMVIMSLAFNTQIKVVSRLIINWTPHQFIRNTDKFKAEGFEFSPSIIHFDDGSLLCKPWELCFEDNEIEKIPQMDKEIPRLFFNEDLNYWHSKWWHYAKMTPVYEEEYARMQILKNFFVLKGFKRIKQLGRFVRKSSKLERELSDLKIHENKIELYQKENQSYLLSLQQYYNLPSHNNQIAAKTENINAYFKEYYHKIKSCCVIIISGKADCRKQWHQLQFLEMLGLKENQSDKRRFSYIAVVDKSSDFVYENSAPPAQIISYDYVVNNFEVKINNMDNVAQIRIPNKQAHISITSMGYDAKNEVSLSEVYVNNIDYSINKRGLNVVIFDKCEMAVIDTFTCDVFGDEALMIHRTR